MRSVNVCLANTNKQSQLIVHSMLIMRIYSKYCNLFSSFFIGKKLAQTRTKTFWQTPNTSQVIATRDHKTRQLASIFVCMNLEFQQTS
ncbi:hypothetical protein BpHYR1_039346 [Brachionus plicatilis]|uniref:Uncharacterized protein n=1 Tax=Brachionus plicatilis TaxID=10195 RepID=A0A3M7SUG7_BRAPC|nr:hypothetical protein BpHYR1_039346 [Brachionus plicatilis]